MTAQRFPTALAIRGVSLAGAVALAASFGPLGLFFLTSAFGKAHISLAFWYQLEAGKWPKRKLFFGALLLLGLFVGYFTLPQAVTAIATIVLFATHFILDEPHLFGRKPDLFTTLESAPFAILYTGVVLETFVGVDAYTVSLVGTLLALVVYMVLSFKKKRAPTVVSWFLLGWGAVAFVVLTTASIFLRDVSPNTWFFGLVITHFFIWLLFYWFRLKSAPVRQATYVSRSVGVHAFFFGLLALGLLGIAPEILVLFTPIVFYVFTNFHILSSLRLEDLRQAIRLPVVASS